MRSLGGPALKKRLKNGSQCLPPHPQNSGTPRPGHAARAPACGAHRQLYRKVSSPSGSLRASTHHQDGTNDQKQSASRHFSPVSRCIIKPGRCCGEKGSRFPCTRCPTHHPHETMPLPPDPAAKRRIHPTRSSRSPTSPTARDQDALPLSVPGPPGERLALFQAHALQGSF